MRSYWISVCPKSHMTGVLIRRVDTETHRKEGYVRTEAEIGVMLPQAKEPGIALNHQRLEEARKGSRTQS